MLILCLKFHSSLGFPSFPSKPQSIYLQLFYNSFHQKTHSTTPGIPPPTMSDSESDCESWKYSWEGHIFMLNESKVLVEKQLTEIEDGRMAQRHVLALARYKKNENDEWDIPIMLRIRYEYVSILATSSSSFSCSFSNTIANSINPKPFGIKDIEENRKDVHEHVLFELELIRHLHSAGKGPELLNSVRHGQIPTLPYPPGFVYFFALERVPGEDLDRIRDDLSLSQLRSIKKQLAGILDVMRPLNRCLAVEDPRCLRYDKAKDKLYVIQSPSLSFYYI